jgi:hypothetical protein
MQPLDHESGKICFQGSKMTNQSVDMVGYAASDFEGFCSGESIGPEFAVARYTDP